jgi:hypothetical protein
MHKERMKLAVSLSGTGFFVWLAGFQAGHSQPNTPAVSIA